jgi:hypothetical protein
MPQRLTEMTWLLLDSIRWLAWRLPDMEEVIAILV